MTDSCITPSFKMSQGAFISYIFLQRGIVPLVIPGTLFIGFLIAGIVVDLRWVIVSFMFLLIVIPAVAAWLYFEYGLRQSTAFNVLPHTIEIISDKIVIHIEAIDDDDENTEDRKKRSTEISFDKESVGEIEKNLDSVIIHLNTHPRGFLWMPYKIEEAETDDVLNCLYSMKK